MSIEHNLKNVERTEEVQEIVDRMPTSFGLIGMCVVILITTLFFVLGFTIRYPDVVIGELTISSVNSPVELVSVSAGKLNLTRLKSQSHVVEGQYIAVIQNSANTDDVLSVKKSLQNFNVSDNMEPNVLNSFPRKVFIGELNVKYFIFLNALLSVVNFNSNNLYDEQDEVLKKVLIDQIDGINSTKSKLKLASTNLNLMHKFIERDSILFAKKVLTEAENDRSQMNFITMQDAYQGILKDISLLNSEIQETENRLKENSIQKNDREKLVYLNLVSAYTELKDEIKQWEEKYVFKAPIDGTLQYLKFWTTNQYIEKGELAFAVIPSKNRAVGYMNLPAFGAGKVKRNQEVIIKLDNYPYAEYGSITGKVSSISLKSKAIETSKGVQNMYLINISLPKGLKTNYGSELDFKFDIRGTGEIVTKDRRLIQRLFDNMRYAMEK